MKNILLKAVCIAAIALPFSAQMVKAATITANLSDVSNGNPTGFPTVKIVLSDVGVPAGTVKVIATVVPGTTGGTGDLRAVYFNLPSGVTNATITRTGGGPITNISGTGVNATTQSLGSSANLNGSGATFGVGVEVGSQGIGGNPPDDFQSVEFTISGTGLTLAGFANTQFGSRMMSVSTSAGGARSESAKTLGNGGTVVTPPSPTPTPSPTGGGGGGGSPTPTPTPSVPSGGGGGGVPSPTPTPSVPSGGGGGGGGGTPDVAEPITILGMGLGLGGLLLSRRNRNKNK